jgi:hypothetical protein
LGRVSFSLGLNEVRGVGSKGEAASIAAGATWERVSEGATNRAGTHRWRNRPMNRSTTCWGHEWRSLGESSSAASLGDLEMGSGGAKGDHDLNSVTGELQIAVQDDGSRVDDGSKKRRRRWHGMHVSVEW